MGAGLCHRMESNYIYHSGGQPIYLAYCIITAYLSMDYLGNAFRINWLSLVQYSKEDSKKELTFILFLTLPYLSSN
jgi:hypothetical protein